MCKCFCKVYVVLFSIIFATNIGVVIYFIQYKYINSDEKTVAKETLSIKRNNLIG